MSAFPKYLVCEDEAHAAAVDALVFEHLRETEGAGGSGWSGVFTDGARFGILWDSPVAAFLGKPESSPDLQIVEDVSGVWELLEG